MKNIIYLFLLSFFMSGCNSFHYAVSISKSILKTQQKTISLDGEEISFYHIESQSPKYRNNVVFYFTGTGCHSVGFILSRQVQILSRQNDIVAIQKQGVSSLSTGKNCSTEYLENEPLTRQLARAKRLIRSILDKERYTKVTFLGSSEGAMLATLLAQEFPEATHLIIEVFDVSKPSKQVFENVYKGVQLQDAWADIQSKITNRDFSGNDLVYGRKLEAWRELVALPSLTSYFIKRDLPILLVLAEQDKKIPVESYKTACVNMLKYNKKNLMNVRIVKGVGHKYPELEHIVQMEIQAWLNGREGHSRTSITRHQC